MFSFLVYAFESTQKNEEAAAPASAMHRDISDCALLLWPSMLFVTSYVHGQIFKAKTNKVLSKRSKILDVELSQLIIHLLASPIRHLTSKSTTSGLPMRKWRWLLSLLISYAFPILEFYSLFIWLHLHNLSTFLKIHHIPSCCRISEK